MLTNAGLSRYARQIVLDEVGIAGQERLATSRVLVIGAGGLGSPAALYLAAAGVGAIGLLDDDEVELSNLHRQILHATGDIGRSKAQSGASRLNALNDQVEVRAHVERLTPATASEVVAAYDVVVDGSDNYPTRYAINDACARLQKPWVYGSVEKFSGQVSVFGVANGPCYRCLFPEPPAPGSTASCEEIGVLGAVPGVVGSLQATEALKLLLGIGRPLVGRLLQLDLLHGHAHEFEFSRRPGCPACSGLDQDAPSAVVDVTPADLAPRVGRDDSLLLVDVREAWEVDVARLPGGRHIPMGELPAALGRLDRDRELVVYCHHGQRSAIAADWLRRQGFRARNLVGGIDRWSRDVDPGVPRY